MKGFWDSNFYYTNDNATFYKKYLDQLADKNYYSENLTTPTKYIKKTIIKILAIEFIHTKIKYSFLSSENDEWKVVDHNFFMEEFNDEKNNYKVESEKEEHIIFKSEITTIKQFKE